VHHLAEIMYDHIQEEDFRKETRVEIGRASRISTPEGVVSNSTSGAYSATDQETFTKSVVLVEDGVPERVEWSNTLPSKIQDGGRPPSLISSITISRPPSADFSKILQNDRYKGAPNNATPPGTNVPPALISPDRPPRTQRIRGFF